MIGLRCAPVMNAQSYLAAPMMKCAAAMSDDDEDEMEEMAYRCADSPEVLGRARASSFGEVYD